jgi:hypothetical protein
MDLKINKINISYIALKYKAMVIKQYNLTNVFEIERMGPCVAIEIERMGPCVAIISIITGFVLVQNPPKDPNLV